MITKFNCSCGNNNPNHAIYYDGFLGYEALVCTECGNYYDQSGEHEADQFSLNFLNRNSPFIITHKIIKNIMSKRTNEISQGHLVSALEVVNDQLQDLRVKLRTEHNPKLIPFRLTVVTHYRNLKIGLMSKFDLNTMTRREINNLIKIYPVMGSFDEKGDCI